MRFLDYKKLPKNHHHLSVLTGLPEPLPLLGVRGHYPCYYLRYRFENNYPSLLDLFAVDGPEYGSHRLVIHIVPIRKTRKSKDELLELMASPNNLKNLWSDIDVAIFNDTISRFQTKFKYQQLKSRLELDMYKI